MPIGAKLSTILEALKSKEKINVAFPVLSRTGKLVYLSGVITDVGDDYVRVQSLPDSNDFYYIPISSIAAVTNVNPEWDL